jgi:hypothetical protein
VVVSSLGAAIRIARCFGSGLLLEEFVFGTVADRRLCWLILKGWIEARQTRLNHVVRIDEGIVETFVLHEVVLFAFVFVGGVRRFAVEVNS